MAQEQQKRFEMPSGAFLAVSVAPFADAWALMKAALKTLKGLDLKSLGGVSPQDMIALKAGKLSMSTLAIVLDRVVDLATSPEVEAAMWKCAQKSLYIPAGSPDEFPGVRVTAAIFDDNDFGAAAREDFAKIQSSLLEVNCQPFLVKALSGFLKPKAATSPEGQPSESNSEKMSSSPSA